MRYMDVKVVYIARNMIHTDHIEWCHAGIAYNCHSIIKALIPKTTHTKNLDFELQVPLDNSLYNIHFEILQKQPVLHLEQKRDCGFSQERHMSLTFVAVFSVWIRC